ncbi:MAG: KEOPS complex subunit Pcc1 [Candidatus Methanomethylophilus sp.]|nr:KEOPS complex subunit Pcc1 [Methanomethylophilus sp.]
MSPVLTLELRCPYADERTAQAVLAAVGPENGSYVQVVRQGAELVFHLQAERAGTLRNTADDLLACLKTAEEAVGLVAEPYIEPEERPE